jgi:nitroimidazol reductase NimA-like FMN-containing flavoprotein (pyridoxamine 5'-phosphate oxidase superfamily)
MENFTPTDRTSVMRLPKRASYDRALVYQILDEGFVCHVGFVVDGTPRVIPTAYGRVGDVLYLHGAKASRMLKALAGGAEACVTVTLVDGLVLARSAFHHSMNYRSVVVFGRASAVEDPREKLAAMRAFSEHLIPGRWSEVREPNGRELAATLVLSLPLAEVSAKVRAGSPADDEEDLALPVWAGELPLRLVAGEPVRDPLVGGETPVSESVVAYARARNSEGRKGSPESPA